MNTNIKPETLKEIAEMLDMGMICFYHKTNGELEYFPDILKNPNFEEDMWAESQEKVEENFDHYLRFEGMDSTEDFTTMEDFIDNIADIPTHNKFIDAISRKKTFQAI